MKHRCTPSQVPQLTEQLVFRMHLLMLASLLPAAMAEFEQVNPHPNPNPNPNPNLTLNLTLSTHCPNSVSQCKRASGKWVGFDQVTPLSTCA